MSGLDLIITITDRSTCELFINWFRGRDIPLVLTALGQGPPPRRSWTVSGWRPRKIGPVLPCPPFPVYGAQGGPGPVAGRAGQRRTDDGARVQHRRHVRQGISDPESGGGGTHGEREIAHELILVIANQGHTDQVMEAARGAGATGGTTIHAKGTGMELAKSFFGVSIASERELVFILTRSQDKKNIMKAIMAQAGIQTPAQAMVFSVPVSDIAGLRHLDQAES